jgi:hypothetical protein
MTDDERDFTEAVIAYQKRTKRYHLTWLEVLNIARGLGWRRFLVEGPNVESRKVEESAKTTESNPQGV